LLRLHVLRQIARPALVIALLASTALLVALALKYQSLEARYRALAARLRDPYVGMYVPPLSVPSIDGGQVTLGEVAGGERQVLFVFNTSCAFCSASVPAWRQVVARLAAEPGVRVYGLSTDSLAASRAYAAEHGLGFPIVSLTEPRGWALYHLHGVPWTLILNGEGRILFVRPGAVEGDAAVDSIVAAALM
jgi:peroxiredoxin